MKTFYIFKLSIFIFAISLMAACNKHENISPNKTGAEFNLITTTGEQLAPNIAYLEEKISKRLVERSGYDIEVTITGIEHLDMPEGLYLARVSYETSEGDKRSQLISNGVPGEDGGLISPNIIKSRIEYYVDGADKWYGCIPENGCTTCPDAEWTRNGNFVTITCGSCTSSSSGQCDAVVTD